MHFKTTVVRNGTASGGWSKRIKWRETTIRRYRIQSRWECKKGEGYAPIVEAMGNRVILQKEQRLCRKVHIRPVRNSSMTTSALPFCSEWLQMGWRLDVASPYCGFAQVAIDYKLHRSRATAEAPVHFSSHFSFGSAMFCPGRALKHSSQQIRLSTAFLNCCCSPIEIIVLLVETAKQQAADLRN
jgi:hypothetical protein